MKKIFNWNLKKRPEDFIVREISYLKCDDKGNHYLYYLIKRNLNTKDISNNLKLSYAGLKDKNALTFQYVSSEKFLGKTLFEKIDLNSFYGLIYLGRIRKKIKIGNLLGNKFSITLEEPSIHPKDFSINYFDTQRLEKNWERGAEIFFSTKNKSSWLDRFLIDSFLSFLWNKALEKFLKEYFEGYYVIEKDFSFFVPFTEYKVLNKEFPKFFPILGYKVKLNNHEKTIYELVLKQFNTCLSDFLLLLKNRKIKGDYRKTYLKPEDVYIKGNRIHFFLPKGGYGSMYIKMCF